MSVHAPHPSIHENGLQDGCERCAEQAEQPFNLLDAAMIRALFLRWKDENEFAGRSRAESRALAVIDDHMVRMGRLLQAVSFDDLADGLRSRGWNVLDSLGRSSQQ